MPKAGDSFTIMLKQAHLGWGMHRRTNSRPKLPGQGYLPIPGIFARAFGIFMSNKAGANVLYEARSADGYFQGRLKAQGNSKKGSCYAKNFSQEGDLRALGTWYAKVGAKAGDRVQITFLSDRELVFELERVAVPVQLALDLVA